MPAAQPEHDNSVSPSVCQSWTVRIELAGEPRGKGRPRFSRRSGIAYTPGSTRTYEAALRHEAALAMQGRAPLDGPLSVTVDAWMPIPASWSRRRQLQASTGLIRPTGRPDIDNLVKTLDALNRVVWRDDSQIVLIQVSKRYAERPRLDVVVSRLSAVPQGRGLHQLVAEGAA
ncbi:MAG TPA: RusA family crossover junction endodeoxyribonuclease [Hyphomicrobiaceae bacterium]|jgi:Holliday junction resolvase RusA-like endonuclease|nr:RusA family crossover junction endodeoxyribonuclease [Hyphomicrobiaceae bacterium]